MLGYLTDRPDFTTTLRMLSVTGYMHSRSGTQTTVFAPVEAAWDKTNLRSLLSHLSPTSDAPPDSSTTVALLRGLAVAGSYPPDKLTPMQQLTTLSGQQLVVDPAGKTVQWTTKGGAQGSASFVGEPAVCPDGVVYPVNGVPGQ